MAKGGLGGLRPHCPTTERWLPGAESARLHFGKPLRVSTDRGCWQQPGCSGWQEGSRGGFGVVFTPQIKKKRFALGTLWLCFSAPWAHARSLVHGSVLAVLGWCSTVITGTTIEGNQEREKYPSK